MATNEGLSLKIGATVDALRKGMAEAKAIIKGTAEEIGRESSAVENAGKSWNQMGKFIFQQTYERKRLIQQVQQGIGSWKLEAAAIEQVGSQAMPALQKGSRGASTALMGLTRIAQDAPFGFVAIGNNIAETVSQMGHLVKTSGGAGGALKALGQSIIGPGGVVLGLNLLITGITVAIQKYGSLGNALKEIFTTLSEAEKRQKAYNSAIENSADAYQKAVTEVTDLRNNIELAKNGLISKEQVVNQYNNSIGKTTGSVKSLDEAEKALARNADAYIKFTLLKAAAQLSLDEAAKKAFEAELKRQKEAREFIQYSDRSFSATAQFGGLDAKTAEKLRIERGEIRKREAIKESEDAKKTFEDIAKKLQTDAAAIASKYQFDFFGGEQDGKKKRTISDVLKTLGAEMQSIAQYNELVGYSIDQLAGEKLSALNKAFEDIAKIGGPQARKELEKLRKQIELVSAGILGDKKLDTKSLLSFDKVNIKDLNTGLTSERLVARVPIDISLIPGNVDFRIFELTDKLIPVQNSLTSSLTDFQEEIGSATNQAFKSGAANLAAGIGEFIGGVVSGSLTLNDAFKGVIGIFGNFIKQLGESMIAAGTAAIAAKLLMKNPYTAVAAGIIAVAAGTAIQSAMNKAPSFATGGAVFGPTMAMIGDNPGREEYVIPSEVLDKLGGGGGYPAEIQLRAAGPDLVGVLKMGQIQNGRING